MNNHYHIISFLVFVLVNITANSVISGEKEQLPQPPVFSHYSGFFTEPFELTLETPYNGIYPYTVSKDGYEAVSGDVTVTDQDIEVEVILYSEKKKSKSVRNTEKSTYLVTFNVEMADAPYEDGDHVYISGNFTDPPWPVPGSDENLQMEQTNDDLLTYSLSFNLPEGNYEYKYFLNEGWEHGEWGGPPNREISINSNTVINDIWGDIDPDDPDEPDDPDTLYTVTFIISDQDNNPVENAVITFDGISHEPGEYIIENVAPAAKVRYTRDGSIPDSDSEVYSTPIEVTYRDGEPNDISMIPTNNLQPGHVYNEHWQPPAGEVFKITGIRSRTFLAGKQPSETVTKNYIVTQEGKNRFSMPIVSINSHRGSFFDADSGIYVHGNHTNYNQRGIEWERFIHFEFFENSGNSVFSQDMGIRIHGGTTRNRPRKSLRLYARSDYGTTWVNYPLFPDKDINRYKRFLLRNSGNDWRDAIFRDAFMQSLLKDMKIDIQYSRPAIVFINGEYWGVHNIRDRLDNRYMQTHYGLDDEMDYTVLEGNAELYIGNPAGINHYQDMLQFLGNPGVAADANYSELKTMMDIKNFTNYQVAQIYFMNTDWPGNNLQYWRYNTESYQPDAPYGLDGRWRWKVFDLDFGFGLNFDYVTGVEQGPAHNTLAFALEDDGPHWPNPPWSTFILRKLIENESFKNHFIIRFADLLNTTFSEDNVIEELAEYRLMYLPEMPEHIHRWRMPESMEHWESEIQVMQNFASERPGYLRHYIAEEFGLDETAAITLKTANSSQGGIRLNTVELHEIEPKWEGIYFTNMQMEVEALPYPGNRFSHWEGLNNNTNPDVSFTLIDDINIIAHFQDALVHYWHFNNLPDGAISAVEADYSTTSNAFITYPGTGDGYMDRTDGTLLNAHHSASAGYGLRVRNPADTRKMLFKAPTKNYKDIIVSFATHRTTNGAQIQEFYYSTDNGENWLLADEYSIETDYEKVVIDLTEIEAVNNNPDLYFKILFEGEEASNTDGNNRFDNIAISGIATQLTIGKSNPPDGYENEEYKGFYFSASGGSPPYEYDIISGNLPQGMSMSSSGLLSGTPSENGIFTFTVEVTDSSNSTDSYEFSLKINHLSLIHYWHFNNLESDELYKINADYSIITTSGDITYPGTGNGYMDRTDGTIINSLQNSGAGYGLRVRNPADTRKLLFEIPSSGYKNLEFSFAARKTTNGAWQQELHISADGGISWTQVGSAYIIEMDYNLYSFDLSSFEDANNNPNLQIKIHFTGDEASGDSGNNRFDNIALHGKPLSVGIPKPEENRVLRQNYPNPFSTLTTIPFEIKTDGYVKIEVYNIMGNYLETITDSFFQAGKHHVVFDGTSYPGGIYIYRIISPGKTESRQMIIMQ